MGNDNKIEPNHIHNEVLLFLGDELERIHQNVSGKSYNLEEEFSKTRQHKSPFVIIVLLICFVVVLGVSITMNAVISRHDGEVKVSLEEFDDLNLKNLLSSVSRAQDNYDSAVKNKSALQTELDFALANAQNGFNNEVFLLDSMNIKDKGAYNARYAQLRQKYEADIAAIHADYDAKLALADAELEEYRNQLGKFDAEKLESAREQEKSLDSERRLKQLEISRLEEKYEAKIGGLEHQIEDERQQSSEEMRRAITRLSETLDPLLDDETANTIISARTRLAADGVTAKSPYTKTVTARLDQLQIPGFDSKTYIAENGIKTAHAVDALTAYQAIYDDYEYLAAAVADVPQNNSVPAYVAASRLLVTDMGAVFAESVKEADVLENCLTAVANEQKANGIVLRILSSDEIQVFLVPMSRTLVTAEGTEVLVSGVKPVRCLVVKNEDETFSLKPETDKDGNIVPIDIKSIGTGNLIRFNTK